MDIGLLYPTRNRGEDDFAALCRRLDPAPGLDFAYVEGDPDVGWGDDLDAAAQTAAVRELGMPGRLAAAADRLPATPDVVSWACSSCSFTHGLDGARDQARALTDHLGVPASSTSLAYLAAWDGHRITELAVAADHEDADAVLVPETALHTTPLLAELDERLRKPVLTATAVTIWDAIGATPAQSGLGTLFSAGPGRRRPSSSAS